MVDPTAVKAVALTVLTMVGKMVDEMVGLRGASMVESWDD